MTSESLIQYNINGALDNILCVEEHLTENTKGVPHQWCSIKHAKLASSHHLRELVEHSAGEDPEFSEKISEFKERFDDARNKPKMDVHEIRTLRNEFRELIDDPSLNGTTKDCGVCALDRRSGESATSLAVNEEKSVLPWVIGGIIVIGIIVLIAKSRR